MRPSAYLAFTCPRQHELFASTCAAPATTTTTTEAPESVAVPADCEPVQTKKYQGVSEYFKGLKIDTSALSVDEEDDEYEEGSFYIRPKYVHREDWLLLCLSSVSCVCHAAGASNVPRGQSFALTPLLLLLHPQREPHDG